MKLAHEPHNDELKLQINALEKYLHEGDFVIKMAKPKKKFYVNSETKSFEKKNI